MRPCLAAARAAPAVGAGATRRSAAAAVPPSGPEAARGAGGHRRPWRIGCWNQHRVGSYAQQACPWVPRLKALGTSAAERDRLLRTLRVEYSAGALQSWAASYDVVALQEFDEPLREALLGGGLGGPGWPGAAQQLLESDQHVDGRGVRVDSRVAMLLLGPAVGAVARCELRVPLRRGGGFAAREHVAALLRRSGTGGLGERSSLVVCSVHLHPPESADGAAYVAYLKPLREILEELQAEADTVNAGASAEVVLAGDFNVSAADFQRLTSADPFWQGFAAVVPTEDGSAVATAHGSNPCETGDFMLSRGAGGPAELQWRGLRWQCRAGGPADFSEFSAFAEGVFADAAARLPLLRARADAGRASEGLERALEALGEVPGPAPRLLPPPPPRVCPAPAAPRPGPPPRQPPGREAGGATAPERHAVEACRAALARAAAELADAGPRLEQLWQVGVGGGTLRKTLFTSDHRPLSFEEVGVSGQAAEAG